MSTIEYYALAWAVFAVAAWLFERGVRRLWSPCVSEHKCGSDQKCPHCDTWQSECGGWAWVGNSDNPMIDFSAECGQCGKYSNWVWIGPGVCATYEEITKQKAVNK